MLFSDINLPSNHKFGFFFTFLFLAAAIYLYSKNLTSYSYCSFGVAFALVSVTLLKPEKLLPLNKLWMKLGILIGFVIAPFVLGIIFFGMFTPIALVMKIYGRDELRLKLKPLKSYWKVCEIDHSPAEGFKNQF